MSGDINEVSLALGRLASSAEEGQRQRDAMFRKLDTIADALQQSIGQQQLLATELNIVKKKINEFQPVIDEMKTLKQRGIGALAVVGIGAGGISAMIVKALAVLALPPH